MNKILNFVEEKLAPPFDFCKKMSNGLYRLIK